MLDSEQEAFERWLSRTRPSGDATSVHNQWLDSYERMDYIEEPAQQAESAGRSDGPTLHI
jgi:hypothetical protein